MIFAQTVSRRLMHSNAEGRRNVEAFFQRFDIDRDGLESLLFRNVRGEFEPYYVSTVPRGLGGSTSDIDLILVAGDASVQQAHVSSMLFHAGRRLGAKVLTRAEIGSSLAAVEDGIAAWRRHEAYPIDNLPTKWADLERLVNGARLDGAHEFASALPILCEWAAIVAFGESGENCLMATLCQQAGQAAAARAYGEGAVMAAMDCVMASCGQVQSNMKWTYERWRRFQLERRPAAVQTTIEAINWARDCIETGEPAWAQTIGDVHDRLSMDILSGADGGHPRLRVASEVVSHPFLPGASTLLGRGLAAVVPRDVLERLGGVDRQAAAQLDYGAADAAVVLTQTGFLTLRHEWGDDE